MKAFEVNFDGLVGPTHNYAGLSYGNVASTSHRASDSNPLEAVLQGLDKMKYLAHLGLKQGVFPPQERPDLSALRKLGFSGNDKRVLQEVSEKAPELLGAVFSASSMWSANAATVSPSSDTRDRKVHFTPANLLSKFHRSLEPSLTGAMLRKIFKDPFRFVHHEPLSGGPAFGDEGAANHTRFCREYGKTGVEFFVFGRFGLGSGGIEPRKFPARQTYEASSAVARNHRVSENAVVFAQQNPAAIDAGVFHNDVVGVGNQDLYFFHEDSFLDSAQTVSELKLKFEKITGSQLKTICVSSSEVSLADAVKSYLFNSQLLTLEDGKMVLLAPTECQETPSVQKYLARLVQDQDQPIREVRCLDLRQSMKNGGGPACLRLRVVLTEPELKAVHRKVLLTDQLHEQLTAWAKKNYRDRLAWDDLRDPSLIGESRKALDELTQILGLGSLYPFQKSM